MTAHPLWHLVMARLRQFFREPETIFWSFGFPAVLSIALGIAFRVQPPAPVDAVIVDGPAAATTAAALAEDGAVRTIVLPEAEAEQRLHSGRAAILVAPGTPVVYRFDPSRPESQAARATVDAALQRTAGRRDPILTTDRHEVAPGARYLDFVVPGLLGMNLMGGGLWGLAWTIVEMRNRKLLKRLLATPMRRSHFLLSHILARLLFAPLEIAGLLFFAWLLFDLHIAGSLLTLALVSLVGVLAFAGLGTLLASRARTMEAASGLINLASFPMILLSGVFFATDRFPAAMQPFIQALPLTALNDALRAVVNEGAGLLTLGPPLLVLGVWGVVSFAAAMRLFRWV